MVIKLDLMLAQILGIQKKREKFRLREFLEYQKLY